MERSISRFCSFVLDFLIAGIFLAILDTIIGPKLTELENYLASILINTSSTLFSGRVLLFYIIFFVIQLYAILYFGVTLGQLSWGIKAQGSSFAQIRIGGAFRLLVAFILTPLIVFDLPILWNKKSFKEIVSLTQLNSTPDHMYKMVGPIVSCVALLIALRSPYFDNYYKQSFSVTAKERLEGNLEPKYNSNYFAWSFNGDVENYYFIPDFKLISQDGVFQTSASLKVYNKVTKNFVTLSRVRGYPFVLDLVKQVGGKDPFFGLFFGELFDFANSFRNFRRLRGGDPPLVISDKLQDDIERFLTYSLSVGNYSPFYSLLKGPFVGGYLIAKHKILEDLEGASAVYLNHINNQKFIRFDYNTMNEYFQYYLPYANNNYTFIYKISSSSNTELVKFIHNIWINSNWWVDYSEYFSRNNFDPLYIIDQISTNNSREFNLTTYNFFYELAKTAIATEDSGLQLVLGESLSNTIFLLENFSMEFSNPSLKVMLETIKVFLTAKDRRYFKLN